MKPFDDLVARAKNNPKHIVLAEGEDPRVIEGALRAVHGGLAYVTLLGRKENILSQISEDILEDGRVQITDPQASKYEELFVQELVSLRKHKGMTEEKARLEIQKPQNFANLMVRLGFADGSVAGAQLTTADVVRSAIQIIGVDPRYSMISSFFIMMLCEPFSRYEGGLGLRRLWSCCDPQ